MTQAAALAAYGSNSPSNRNRIINSAMMIDQRNAGASVTPTDGQYTIDRWKAGVSAASKFSVQQSSVAPTGFNFSMLCTSLSAYSVGTNDNFEMFQLIEGFNTADLGWGTANAKSVTLSFWVRSSLTGTFGGSIQNSAFNRSYPFSYTISAANTWEQKTITIAGDTSGTWIGATNGTGIVLCIGLGAGTGRSGTAGTWASATYYNATGATSVVGTSGATFYITGVQLEEGSVATPFEHRLYGQELALCKRYYQKYVGGNGNYGYIGITMGVGSGTALSSMFPFEQEMRAAPSTSYDVTGMGTWDGASLRAITAISTEYKNTKGMRIDMTVGGGGLTTGHSYSCYGSSSTVVQLNAEL